MTSEYLKIFYHASLSHGARLHFIGAKPLHACTACEPIFRWRQCACLFEGRADRNIQQSLRITA
jgi:hypothetical protein